MINTSIDYKRMGERIRAKRQQKNLSQRQLAEMIGVNTTYISHIERGYTKVSMQTFVHLCNALELTADELLCGYIHLSKLALVNENAALLLSYSYRELGLLYEMLMLLRAAIHVADSQKTGRGG